MDQFTISFPGAGFVADKTRLIVFLEAGGKQEMDAASYDYMIGKNNTTCVHACATVGFMISPSTFLNPSTAGAE